MLPADETQALAARARMVARAVVGLVLDEERAARFVHAYSTGYRRPGIAGETERKAEFLAAIERESLLLVAARIERTLPQIVGSRFSRQAQGEVAPHFREAYLTFLGGSLAWDNDEREAFRKDLAMYLRLADREGRMLGPRRGQAPAAGAFVDRCAFLVDPSMMTQAREAAARYQAELLSCADQAVRAGFRGLHARRVTRPKLAPRRRRKKPASPRSVKRSTRRKTARRRKTASRRKRPRRSKPASRPNRSRRGRRRSPRRRRK